MNTWSDPAALQDTELLDCVNFEVDLDGSLFSRPPIRKGSLEDWGDTNFRILTTAFFNNQNYYILSHSTGIWYYSQGGWTLITNTIQATTAVQWKEPTTGASCVYIPARPGEANPGGYWSPSRAWTTIPNLPKCTSILTHKDRLYCAGMSATPSVVQFSDPLNGSIFGANSNFNVNISDGEVIIDMIVFNDAITIFKNNATYVFPFDTSPTTGVIRRISGTIGVSGKDCCFIYETSLYLLHDNNIYEVMNYDFSRLNTKVPFEYDSTAPAPYATPFFISQFGDRLIARYYNRIYVFGFRTRTWTRWESAHYFGPLWKELGLPTGIGYEKYMAPSCLTTDRYAYFIQDGYETGVSEEMTCRIATKIYDLAISAKYKRLFWWGCDINTVRNVKGTVIPITSVYRITWDQLATYKWSDLKTWDYPLVEPPSLEDIVVVGGGSYRRFIKFLKAIRFRQVQFEVEMYSSGEPIDSPARFFNITAFIGTRETVVKKVS
ncbi:MAG: hypothetical protein ABW007_15085 [Chitinophagaceae bacterium]